MRRADLGQLWILALAMALSVQASDALADKRAGEKKAQLCLLCHRVDGTVGAPTLEQQPSKYLAAQINLFKSGKRPGPSMQANVRNLSSKDIQDIAEYFSSQRAKSALFRTDPDPKAIALGAETAKQLGCASCHSEDFRGTTDVPRLAGQVPHYLARQISDFKGGARPHPLSIPALGEKLPDSAIEALGAYFGRLEP